MMNTGLALFIAGLLGLGIGGASFKIRAVFNKKAWGGITKPFLLVGIFLAIVGLVIVVMAGKARGQF